MNVPQEELDVFGRTWARAMNDIIFFAEHYCRLKLSSEQRKFLLHVMFATKRPGPKRVIARSGQGCGKTVVLCIAILWRHLRSEGTISVITAPTQEQCRNVFFAELRRIVINAHPILASILKITASQAHVLHPKWGDGWKIMSRTASDPDCLRGLHHPNMTVGVEEMSGVDDQTLNTMIGTCSQEDNLLMGIGNPSKREGYFYRAFMDKNVAQNWPRFMQLSRHKLSEERPDICTPATIEALLREWGEDSDAYRVNVLGEFPKIGGDTVLPVDWVNLAAETPMHKASVVAPDIKRITADFARFGGDENVVYRRQGNAILEAYHQALMEPTQTVYRAKRMAIEANWRPFEFDFVADATGMGQPLMQLLREPVEHMHQSAFKVYEWHNHASVAMWNKKYHNQITAAWFEFRHKLYEYAECGGEPVSIPDDRHLIEQLISMKYKFDNKNRYKVLTKDEYKKETELDSPDRAEACVMSFCDLDPTGGRSFMTEGEGEFRSMVEEARYV